MAVETEIANDIPRPIDLSANLRERLLKMVCKATGIADLEYDSDGDICLRYGEQPVYVSLRGDVPYVRFHSVLATDLTEEPRLLEWINEINPVLGHQHLFAREGIVHAVTYVPAFPLVAEHLSQALIGFGQTAESLSGLLQEEFPEDGSRLSPVVNRLRH